MIRLVLALLVLLLPTQAGAVGTADGNVPIGTASAPASMLGVYGNAAIGASYAVSPAAPTNGLIIQGIVGIGTATPNASVALDLGNTTSAMILPKGTTMASPVAGMMRYNTATSSFEGYDGVGWYDFGGALGTFDKGTAAAPGWSVTQDTASGLFQSATATTLSIAAGGKEAGRFLQGAGTVVNYPTFTGAATGANPIIAAAGTDTNIGISLTTKGTGALTLATAGTGAINFATTGGTQTQVTNTASAVNYVTLTGGATGTNPLISVAGSDTVIGLSLTTSGAGGVYFSKAYSATTSGGYVFDGVGGLSSDANGGAFWRSVMYRSHYINVGGSNYFPQFVQYFENDSFINPTVRNYNLNFGNTGNVAGTDYNIVFGNGSGGAIIWATTSAVTSPSIIERMRVASVTGNVGIGTTNPSTVLQVNSSGATRALRLSGLAGGSSNYEEMQIAGDASEYRFGVGGSAESAYGVANKYYIFDLSSNAMRFVLDSSGDVGIGTTSVNTNAKLAVNGGLAVGTYANTATTAVSNGLIVSGNVGVGTSGPSWPLDIDSTTNVNQYARIYTTAASSQAALRLQSGTNWWDVTNRGTIDAPNNRLSFFNNGGERVTISNGGSVGIGSATPQASLDLSQKTDAIIVPQGATEPGSPVVGMMRYNTATSSFEGYDGTGWYDFGGVAGTFDPGTVSAPGWAVSSDTASGLYQATSTTVSVAAGGTQAVRFLKTASAVNYPTITGATTGNAPIFAAAGTDTNVGLILQGKGSGGIIIQSNGSNVATFANSSSSYVDSFNFGGGSVGSSIAPSLSVTGTDTNISMSLATKGTGIYFFSTGNGLQAEVLDNGATAVNYLTMKGAATGVNPTIAVAGTDTNVSLILTPKGTGGVGIGTTSSSSTLTVNGNVIALRANALPAFSDGGNVATGIGSGTYLAFGTGGTALPRILSYGINDGGTGIANIGSGGDVVAGVTGNLFEAGYQANYGVLVLDYSGNAGVKGGLNTGSGIGIGTTALGTNAKLAVNGGVVVGTYANTATAAVSNGLIVSGTVGVGTSTIIAGTVLDLSNNNSSMIMPKGNTAQEPGTPIAGMVRYNTTNSSFEGYDGVGWYDFGGVAGTFDKGTASAPGWAVSTDTASGLFQSATSSTVSISAGGTEAVRFTQTASAVDYLSITGAATASTGTPTISAAGTDTNINIVLTPKGTGAVNITTASTGLLLNGQNAINYPSGDSTAKASIAIGSGALANETAAGSAAYSNTAIGYRAIGVGTMTTAAVQNTALGYQALKATTSGGNNTASGYQALSTNTTSSGNTAVGSYALLNNNIGSNNTAIGSSALRSQYSSGALLNTAVGAFAGQNIGAAGYNTLVGASAGSSVTSGFGNIIIGYSSGNITTGSFNIIIGTSNIVNTSAAVNNQLDIGDVITGVIGSTGKIGIDLGTTAPVNALDVSGAMAIGAGYAGVTTAPTGGLIVSGAVGIGTTVTAAAGLDVLNTQLHGTAVSGLATNGDNSGTTTGVYGEADPIGGIGVWGVANADAVFSGPSIGVEGDSAGGSGVGVEGYVSGASGVGVVGESFGVGGTGADFTAFDASAGNVGVYAEADGPGGYAVHAVAGGAGAYGIYSSSGANYFNGSVGIGTATINTNAKLAVNGGLVVGTYANTATTAVSNGLIVSGAVGIGTSTITTGAALDLGNNTNSIILPKGTTGQEPTGAAGMVRYNTTTSSFEGYDGVGWYDLGGAFGTFDPGSAAAPGFAVSSDTASGLYQATASTISITAGGKEAGRFLQGTGTVVNYPTFKGAATGSAPIIAAAGTDTNISLNLTPKGTGSLNLTTGGILFNGTNALSFAPDVNNTSSIAIGFNALTGQSSANSYSNIAIGYQALGSSGLTSAAQNNVALGYQSLTNNTAGSWNVAIGGYRTLYANTTGISNTVVGYAAAGGNTIGSNNTAVGQTALGSNTTGYYNAAFGGGALYRIVGTGNTGIGYGAIGNATAGSFNTALGENAGSTVNGGSSNTILGYNVATTTLVSGSSNILIGVGTTSDAGGADTAAAGTNNFLNIGNTLEGNMVNATGIGKETLYLNSVANSVNYVQIAGAATGANPVISAMGTDTNVSLNLTPKGSGSAYVTSNYMGIGTTAIAAVRTITLDINAGANTNAGSGVGVIANGTGIATYRLGNSSTSWDINLNDSLTGANALDFANGTSKMMILPAGNVGIGTTAFGTNAKLAVNGGLSVGTYANTAVAVVSNGAAISGSVGIGTTVPAVALDVVGAIYSRSNNAGSSTSIDWSTSNIAYTTASCGAFTFTNMQDGGTYQLFVEGATSGTCSFSQSGLTFKMPPNHGATTASTMTVYSFTRAGSNVFVSWTPGY